MIPMSFSFVLMENLRYMLSQYNPKVSLFFGHRFIVKPKNDSETDKLDEEGEGDKCSADDDSFHFSPSPYLRLHGR
jgi:hypothetical protein